MTRIAQTLKFFALGAVLTLTSANVRHAPQEEQVQAERVPTGRSRSDTFPRWQNPTSAIPFACPIQPPPAGLNPFTVISGLNPADNSQFRTSAMAVDSRNVIHLAGIWTDQAGDTLRVFYLNNSPDTRGASGFGTPVTLAEYTDASGPFDYRAPEYVNLCVDNQDSVRVVWCATRWEQFSGSMNGLPYQVNRFKRDIFSTIKTAAGWQPIVQLTTADCRVDLDEGFRNIHLEVAANGIVQAAGLRVRQSYYWWQNQAGSYGEWRLAALAAGGTFEDLCYWPNLFASGMPQVLMGAVNDMGGFDISPSGDLAVTYQDAIVGAVPDIHVFSLRFTGAIWQPAFDVCGAGGGGVTNLGIGDVAFDSMNQPHYTWLRDISTPTSEFNYITLYRFNTGAESQVNLVNTSTIHPTVLIDSRDNVHVTYLTPVSWDNALLWEPFYAARVNNPGETTWRRQDIIASPVFEQASTNLGGYGATVIIPPAIPIWASSRLGRNDQIHFGWDPSQYSCTMEYGLGARDPAGEVPALPGGTVNVTNGNLHCAVNLFNTKGVEPNQSLSLIYNSLDPDIGSIAPGWRLNYDIRLIDHGQGLNDPRGNFTDQPRECITLVMPDGRRVHFGYRTYAESYEDLGILVPYNESGFWAMLQRTSWNSLGANYELTFKDGEQWIFGGNGRLLEMRQRDGNIIALGYSMGLLQTIKDQTTTPSMGRTTTIYYQEQSDARRPPRINYVQDPAGKQYFLTYSGNELAGVIFPDPGPFADVPQYEFEYYSQNDYLAGAKIGLLRYFRTPRARLDSEEWTCKYRPDGRCVRVLDPWAYYLLDSEGDSSQPYLRQSQVAIDYYEAAPPELEPPGIVTPRKTLVWDRRGYPHRYLHESRRHLVREIHDPTTLTSMGEPIANLQNLFSVQRTFDDYGNLVSIRDRYGSMMSYTYTYTEPTAQVPGPPVGDDFAMVTRGDFIVAAYVYTEDGFHQLQSLATWVTPTGGGYAPGRWTFYEYDSVGRLLTVSPPDTVLADGTEQTAATSYQYNGLRGALSRITDEEGNETNFGNHHATHGLPQVVTREGGTQSEDFLYDSMGNLTQNRKPQGGTGNDQPGWTYYFRDNLYRVWGVSDPAGHTTNIFYDVDSNITAISPPAGSDTTYSYDPRGFRSGGSTPDGSWGQWIDANGNSRRVADLRGSLTNTDYDSLNRPTQLRSQGGTTIGSQNGGGPSLHTVSYGHDVFVNGQRRMTLTQGSGAGARVTTRFLDGWGRVTASLAADGLTRQEYFYNELDMLEGSQSRYDGTLLTCQVTFRDDRDRVYRTRNQDVGYGANPVWSENSWLQLNRTGRVVRTIGPRGNPTQANNLTDKVEFTLDARSRVTEVKQPVGNQMTIVQESIYGDDDLIIEKKAPDPTGLTAQRVTVRKYAYTARKELKSDLNANNKGVTYTYGPFAGQVDTATDSDNRVTKHTYHAETQRVNEVFEAWLTNDERKTIHTWENGLLTEKQVWNPQSQSVSASWTYAYDRGNRLERMADPQGAPEVYRYDQFSGLDQIVAGQKTEARSFDMLGQLTGMTVSGAFSSNSQISYDGAGNPTQVVEGLLRKDIAWNVAQGVPVSESFYLNGNLWKSMSHEYDEAGDQNLMTYTDPASTNHEWVRDDAGRLTGIRFAGVEVCSMVYTSGGLLRLTVLRNSSGNTIAQTIHDYDWLGRHVRAWTVRVPSQATLSDIRWEYDNLDRIVKIRYVHLGAVTDLGYNARGEVITENTDGNGNGMEPPPFTNIFGNAPTGNDSSPSNEAEATPGTALQVPDRTASYVYDKGGNRISETLDGLTTTLAYDSASRLISETRTGRSVTHLYDEWGNETERTTVEAGTTTVETYGYNSHNLMSTYVREVGASIVAQWQYDFWPTGERYGKTNLATGNSELYVNFQGNVVADYSRNSSGVISFLNTYGQGLGLDQKSLRISSTGERVHYLGDQVGTLAMSLTDTGARRETCFRDIWGNTLAGDTNDERYGFAQREHDMESGLVYMRHRMYDPRIGRFTQADPIKANRPLEQYLYAGNTPISDTDPLGLYKWRRIDQIKPFLQYLYGDQGLLYLNAFIDAGGGFKFDDIGFLVWGDSKFRGSESGKRPKIWLEENVDGFTVATLLWDRLVQATRDPIVERQLIKRLRKMGDSEAIRTAMQNLMDQVQERARAAGNLLATAAAAFTVVNEGADWCITLNELSEGNWAAVTGFLPFIPAGGIRIVSKQGDNLLDIAGGTARGPLKALTTSEKDALRTSARELWQATAGRRASWDKLQVHHRIPLEWSHLMPGDPNRLSNLVGVSADVHGQITKSWAAWKVTLGRTPTPTEVMQKALDIDKNFGEHMVFPK